MMADGLCDYGKDHNIHEMIFDSVELAICGTLFDCESNK